MTMKKLLFVFVFLLFLPGISQAEDFETVVRLTCTPKDQGAQISINGSFKAECSTGGPVNIFIPAGSTRVEVKKMPDAYHEQIFTEHFTAVAGVPKRINVVLSEPQLNAAGREAEARDNFNEQLAAAKNGDIAAMETVASLYSQGKGVKQDSNEASHWRQQLAVAKEVAAAEKDLKEAYGGKLEAMESMVKRYKTGQGVDKDEAAAGLWQEKANDLKEKKRLQQLAAEKRSRTISNQRSMESELAKVSYRKNQKAFDDWVGSMNSTGGASDAGKALVVSVISLPAIAGALVLDTVSFPTRVIERHKIKKKYEAHAGAWARPNSMLAKVYSQQPQETGEPLVVIAAR